MRTPFLYIKNYKFLAYFSLPTSPLTPPLVMKPKLLLGFSTLKGGAISLNIRATSRKTEKERKLADGRRGWRGKGPNHTTARRSGPL